MLYNKAKGKQSFLTLINATISHELRNPLNSLVGQTDMLNQYVDEIKQVLQLADIKKLKAYLFEIFHKIVLCSSKVQSATKFTDFFVHDILDYTILNKEEKNFVKNL